MYQDEYYCKDQRYYEESVRRMPRRRSICDDISPVRGYLNNNYETDASNTSLDNIEYERRASFQCRPLARSSSSYSREMIRCPTPPPIYERFIERAATPEPEIIERVIIRPQAQKIIERIIERPRTPPPVIINKEISEPAQPPIIKTRYIDVEPRCKSNLDLTYQRQHSKIYESNQLPPVQLPSIVQSLPAPQQQQQHQHQQPIPIPIHHTPVKRQVSATSAVYTSQQSLNEEIPPHEFHYKEKPLQYQRFNSQPDLTRYNQFYYPSNERLNTTSSNYQYSYNQQDCIPTSQPATIINTAHGQYCIPNSQINGNTNNNNRKGKNNLFKSIFGCCKSKKGQTPNQRKF